MASPPSKSRVRVFSFLIATLFSVSASGYIPPATKIPYAEHCSSDVPESVPDSLISDPQSSFQLYSRYLTGGEQILQQIPSSSPNTTLARSWNFNPRSLRRTKTPGILQIEGSLTLFGDQSRSPRLRNLTFASRRTRRRFYQRKVVRFDLSGFWSNSTGKLCMVGRGFERSKLGNFPEISAVFKLNYPMISTISTSIVNGTIESLSSKDALNYFNPISLLVYAQKNYEYTLLSKVRDSCSVSNIKEESIGFESYTSSCSYLMTYMQVTFKLEYGSNSSSRSKNSGPFNKNHGFSSKYMSFNQIQCSDDGRLHFSISFYNGSSFRNDALFQKITLVAEGVWDLTNNRLCLMACRVVNIENSMTNPYDCTIGISLWFPVVHSIRSRSSTVGRIRSNLNESDSSYFSMISFRSLNNYNGYPGLIKYNYTETSVVRNYCSKRGVRHPWKQIYPDGNSVRDLMFDVSMTNSEGISLWVSAIPLFIGDTFYADPYDYSSAPIVVSGMEEIDPHASTETLPAYISGEVNHTTWNVSYKIRFSPRNSSSYAIEPIEISAEGTYDSLTGAICMIGCQDPSSSFVHVNNVDSDVDSIDCRVLIDIQLAPLNPKAGEHLIGTISSTRPKSDKLYFEALNMSSYFLYESVAVESIWRMDIETIMVLVSLTATCIFIGLQIFHVKKHPNVLPSISFMMLLILTLGRMIPLVLNAEALFSTRYRSGVVWLGDGWFEANEIIVRATTMVALLLQCRLLQLSWSARSSSEEGNRGFWVAELKALFCSLPLYVFVGLIAWLFDLVSYGARQQRSYINADAGRRRSLSGYLISCAGLLLDGFLLPQVILNIFSGSTKDTILAPSFYFGNTGVRAMPHIYDAYRAHQYNPYVNSTYIYASPISDFYSNAWDIIVPCGGMLLAVIIFLQQRFGGGCVIPSRFRKSGGYTKVSEIGL